VTHKEPADGGRLLFIEFAQDFRMSCPVDKKLHNWPDKRGFGLPRAPKEDIGELFSLDYKLALDFL
jgi:hypothetical protein